MRLIIDANVLIAALIKKGITRQMLTNRKHEYSAPSFLLDEIMEHLSEIAEKAGIDEEMVPCLLGLIVNSSNIRFFDAEKIKETCEEAKAVSPDPDDWPYFAIALKEKIPIWTNDSLMKKQDKVRVYATSELVGKL